MNEYKLFLQRIGLTGITNILVALSSLILLPILTKSFSVSDYGVWVQISTTISLLICLTNLGLPYTMVRFLSSETDKTKIQEGFYSITFLILISTSIVSLILLVFSKNIAIYLFNGNVNLSMLIVPLAFFACLDGFLLNYFRTFQQMKRYSTFLILQTYLGVFIVSYLVLMRFGIYAAVVGLLIANLIVFIMMLFFIIQGIGFKLPKFTNTHEYLSFGLPTVPGNLSYWIVDSSDRYVLGIILGTTFVGYYSPGYALGYLIIMILSPFSILLPAILPKYYEEKNLKEVHLYLNYSLKFFFLIAIPSVFGLSLLSKPLLMILTTTDIALKGYLVTPFVALGSLLYGFQGIINNVLILEKKTKVIGITWIFAAILNLGLNILLIPYFGIIGAAVSTLMTYLLAALITFLYSTKFFKFNFDINFTMKSVLSSLLMAILLFIINPYGIMNILIAVLICCTVYFALIIILGGITKDEIKFFKKMLNS